MKAMYLPSGDHAGSTLLLPDVRKIGWPVPSAFIIAI
jgi:hypothetical protein